MNEATKISLLRLLEEAENLYSGPPPSPYDLNSLRQYVYYIEFKNEVDYLKNLPISSFETDFVARCRWRMNNPDSTIPLSEMPNCITNKLYLNIARLVFQPKTLQGLLAVVLPDLESHVKVNLIPSEEAKTSKERLKNLEVSLEETSHLNELDEVPSIEHVIISHNKLFDVHSISLFPLKYHASLQQILTLKYPDLAAKLYTHNEDCRQLELDVQFFNSKGITPKEAIRQLARGLAMGGTRITGQFYATKSSSDAVKQFLRYFNGLPVETQVALREMKCSSNSMTTLDSIISIYIEKGLCVETTSAQLNQLLQHNCDLPLLNLPSAMSVEYLKEIENKYKSPRSLNTIKSSQLVRHLPVQLTAEAIKNIAPRTDDELLLLFLNVPTELYETLWINMYHRNIYYNLGMLALFIKEGFINNQEQKEALARVLIKNFPRDESFSYRAENILYSNVPDQQMTFWAADTNDPIFLREALHSYPLQIREEQVQILFRDYKSKVSVWVQGNLPMLEALFSSLPVHKRLTVMKPGELIELGIHPQHLKTLLELLPFEHRLNAVMTKMQFGESLLFYAATRPELFRVLVELLPMPQGIDAISMATFKETTLLQQTSRTPESRTILMEVYKPLLPDLARQTNSKKVLENKRLALLNKEIAPSVSYLSLLPYSMANVIQEHQLEDSFVPDFLKILNFLCNPINFDNRHKDNELRKHAYYLKCNLCCLNSFEEIKKLLIAYITKHYNTPLCLNMLRALDPERKTKGTFQSLKNRCYRSSLIAYLEDQLEALPKTSGLRVQLKKILIDIQQNQMNLNSLKRQVDRIKEVVDIHQDTGLIGFFKCNWARHTTNYKQLAELFNFEHDNNYKHLVRL